MFLRAFQRTCQFLCIPGFPREDLWVLVYLRMSQRGLFPAPYQDWGRLERKEFNKFASGNIKCKSQVSHWSKIFPWNVFLYKIHRGSNPSDLLNPRVCFHRVYRVGMYTAMRCIHSGHVYAIQTVACVLQTKLEKWFCLHGSWIQGFLGSHFLAWCRYAHDEGVSLWMKWRSLN